MKKLFYKTLIFIIPLAICLFFLFLVPMNMEQIYTVPKKVTTVFVGDSHIKYAIDSTNNYGNYSVNSQSIFFSYHLVKKLIQSNGHIKNIVIGLAPHNIIDAEHRFTENAYAKYFHLLSLEEKKALFKTGAITNYITFFRAFIIEKFTGDFYKTDSGKQKQKSLSKQAVLEASSMEQRIKFQYYEGDTLSKRITRDSLYYKKLIELAAAENITIEFISTPTFHGYEERIPGEIKNIFKDFITTNKIPYKDLSSYKQLDLYPDNFILDGDHLSVKGSKQFTDYISNHKNFN